MDKIEQIKELLDKYENEQIYNEKSPPRLIRDRYAKQINNLYFQESQPEGSDLLLKEDEIEAIYEHLKKDTYEYSEKYHSSISADNFDPNRPAERSRYFTIAFRKEIQMETAKAQFAKCQEYYEALLVADKSTGDALDKKLEKQTREKTLKEVCGVYDKYIDLLNDELNELAAPAFGWGWKSTRYEQGVKCRQNISNLKSGILPKEEK